MKPKKRTFYQQQASLLVQKKTPYEVTLSDDVNVAADSSPDHLLFQHYVKANPKPGVLVKEADVQRTDYSQIVEAIKEFEIDDEAKTMFIPINLYGKHAVHARIIKISGSEELIFEYSDPYGSKSPYGNPPQQLINELKEQFGRDIIIKPIPTNQQGPSSSCFAINYQNMIDKYEGRTPSIKATENGQEDSLVKQVRLQMKQDLHWVYDQYNKAKETVQKFVEDKFPVQAAEREKIQEEFSKPRFDEDGYELYDVYDPEDYGPAHQELAEAEVEKAAELLANINFSQAPSQTASKTSIIEFPSALKNELENEGYNVVPLYDLKKERLIGYSIDVKGNLSVEEFKNVADALDKKLPPALSDLVIYSQTLSKAEPNEPETTSHMSRP